MQGFNKYYPPEWTPEDGNLNKYNGKHALGDRARKLDQGILIVRFELPYNIWCDNCGNHIGMGVRYNAEKKKVGMYYTTPVWSFRCKCHLCQGWFEIRTDPKNAAYIVHSGARQKNEEWDPAENGGIVLTHPDPSSSSSTAPPDPFSSLEKTLQQKKVALTASGQLSLLEGLQESRWKDPYALSSMLRGKFRGEKKVRVESEGRDEEVRRRYGLGERVGVGELRTPVRGGEERRREDREWEEARREKERRGEKREGKRRREEESVGWRAEKGERKRVKEGGTRTTSSSKEHRKLHSSSSSSPPLSKSASSSSALNSLQSKILLNSALKADPFRSGGDGIRVASGSGSGSRVGKKMSVEGLVKFGKGRGKD